MPEESGSGATPHSLAKAASLDRRSGLSPAASRAPAASVPPSQGEQPRGGLRHHQLQVSVEFGDLRPEYKKYGPEGKFGHYLIMVGALGGAACRAKGEQFSDYEAAIGTGQAHMWFERPEGGWVA